MVKSQKFEKENSIEYEVKFKKFPIDFQNYYQRKKVTYESLNGTRTNI